MKSLLLILCTLAMDSRGHVQLASSVSYANVSSPFNQTFNLACNLGSGQNISIAWYFNNTPLCPELQQQQQRMDCLSLANVINNGTGTLVFSNLTLDQAGWYTCAAASQMLGREEMDFLLIVQEPPTLQFTLPPNFEYVTVENSRVELPCLVGRGQPYPVITWFRNNTKIMNERQGAISPYLIDQNTGSLIIRSVQQSDSGSTFHCTAHNRAGSVESSNVTVATARSAVNAQVFSSNFSALIGNQSALYYTQNQGERTQLTCADLTTVNLTVVWMRDFMALSQTNVTMSGFYCCQVLNTSSDEILLTVCATLVVLGPPSITSPPPIITLPANQKRVANLLCQGPTAENIYAPLNFSWEDENGQRLTQGGKFELQQSQRGLSYLRVTRVEESMTFGLSCVVNRSTRRNITIRIVDVCGTNNVLSGFGADFDNELDFMDSWNPSGEGATYNGDINFESVFVIEGNATLQQTFTVSGNSLMISGRVRQSVGNGTAIIRVISENSVFAVLSNPDPLSQSWQWVGMQVNINPEAVSNITMELAFTGNTSGTAYFDDLCASFISLQTGSSLSRGIIAAASVGAAVVIVVVLVAIIILRYCCVCKRNPKNLKNKNAVLMSRVTKTLLEKWKKADKEAASELNTVELGSAMNADSPSQAITSDEIRQSVVAPGEKFYYTEAPNSSVKCKIEKFESLNRNNDKNNERADDDDDDDGYVITRQSNVFSSPVETSSPFIVVSPNLCNLPSKQSLSPKGVVDFGEDDFAFVDPKILVTDAAVTRHVRSYSANHLKEVQSQDNVIYEEPEPSNKTLLNHQSSMPNSRSMGDFRKQAPLEYSYIQPEVDWALAKKHTPNRASRLSSSTDEEEEGPIYENELQVVGSIEGESIYENEMKVLRRNT